MGISILVVEDEPDIMQLVLSLLIDHDYDGVGASDPEAALALASHVRPSLFLIDIMLPRETGIELAEQLRSQGFADTPIIAMTASKLMSELAVESGLFQAAIDKPFDIDVLIACIERYITGG